MDSTKLQIYSVVALFLFSVSCVAIEEFSDTTPKIQATTEIQKQDEKILTTENLYIPIDISAQTPVQLKSTQKKQNNIVPVQLQKTTATNKHSVKENIIKYSLDMDVDPVIALSIAKIESNFDHSKTSSQGAVGVFQMLPSTARSLGYNAYKQQDNIKGGITYYKKMYQKFGTMDLALAAYNAGPGNVKRYNGVPPFAETQRYIMKIKKEYENQKNEPLLEKYQNSQM